MDFSSILSLCSESSWKQEVISAKEAVPKKSASTLSNPVRKYQYPKGHRLRKAELLIRRPPRGGIGENKK